MKNNIDNLNNRIYIVVDNLERVLDENLTIGVLGFLHKLESLTHKKLKIIVLADSKQLRIEKINEDYLNKFFIKSLELKSISIDEILNMEKMNIEKMFNDTYDDVEDYFEIFKKVFSSVGVKMEVIDKIINSTFQEGFEGQRVQSFEKDIYDFAKQYESDSLLETWWNDLNNINFKLQNPRNVKRIIEVTKKLTNEFSENYYLKQYFSNESHFRTIVYCAIFKILCVNELNENQRKLSFDYLVKPMTKTSNFLNSEFSNHFFIVFFFHYDEWLNRGKFSINKSKDIVRILKDKESDYDDKVKNFMNNLEKEDLSKIEFSEVIQYLISFYEYLDIENKSQSKYELIMNYYLNAPEEYKSDETISDIINSGLLKLDKNYYLKEAKTIIPLLFVKKEELMSILENLYFAEFNCFSKKYLGKYFGNFEEVDVKENLRAFRITYIKKFNLGLETTFEVLSDIIKNNRLNQNDFFSKPLKKLYDLCVETSIIKDEQGQNNNTSKLEENSLENDLIELSSVFELINNFIISENDNLELYMVDKKHHSKYDELFKDLTLKILDNIVEQTEVNKQNSEDLTKLISLSDHDKRAYIKKMIGSVSASTFNKIELFNHLLILNIQDIDLINEINIEIDKIVNINPSDKLHYDSQDQRKIFNHHQLYLPTIKKFLELTNTGISNYTKHLFDFIINKIKADFEISKGKELEISKLRNHFNNYMNTEKSNSLI